MKRFFKFFLVLICLFIINTQYIYAVDINMDIPDNSSDNINIVENSTINTVENTQPVSTVKTSTTRFK